MFLEQRRTPIILPFRSGAPAVEKPGSLRLEVVFWPPVQMAEEVSGFLLHSAAFVSDTLHTLFYRTELTCFEKGV